VAAIEYYNARLDHYFFTADVGEQAALDGGQFGAEWQRTGKSFPVVLAPGCPNGDRGTQRIYRFAGEPNVGPNSHFFTVSQDECGLVRDRKDWHWQFEGAPFWAIPPTAGACPDRTVPLYRAYNDGQRGDPNHRYSIDRAVIDAMVAQGWTDEGARMCVPAKL
jgi:serine protease